MRAVHRVVTYSSDGYSFIWTVQYFTEMIATGFDLRHDFERYFEEIAHLNEIK
jgi:hypothetical protein